MSPESYPHIQSSVNKTISSPQYPLIHSLAGSQIHFCSAGIKPKSSATELQPCPASAVTLLCAGYRSRSQGLDTQQMQDPSTLLSLGLSREHLKGQKKHHIKAMQGNG